MATQTVSDIYLDKLKDPRWQKKRLEIFERDNWTCQFCGTNEATLNVHHKFYLKGNSPWEYPNQSLITLCESCHKAAKDNIVDITNKMLDNLKQCATCYSISDLNIGLRCAKEDDDCDAVIQALGWVLCSPKLRRKLVLSYYKSIKRTNIKIAKQLNLKTPIESLGRYLRIAAPCQFDDMTRSESR